MMKSISASLYETSQTCRLGKCVALRVSNFAAPAGSIRTSGKGRRFNHISGVQPQQGKTLRSVEISTICLVITWKVARVPMEVPPPPPQAPEPSSHWPPRPPDLPPPGLSRPAPPPPPPKSTDCTEAPCAAPSPASPGRPPRSPRAAHRSQLPPARLGRFSGPEDTSSNPPLPSPAPHPKQQVFAFLISPSLSLSLSLSLFSLSSLSLCRCVGSRQKVPTGLQGQPLWLGVALWAGGVFLIESIHVGGIPAGRDLYA